MMIAIEADCNKSKENIHTINLEAQNYLPPVLLAKQSAELIRSIQIPSLPGSPTPIAIT